MVIDGNKINVAVEVFLKLKYFVSFGAVNKESYSSLNRMNECMNE